MVIRWLLYTIIILSSTLLGWVIINPFIAERLAKDLLKEDLEKAIHYSPNNAHYHYLLGRVLETDLELLDLKSAIESYKRTLRLNPLYSRTWLALARAYEGLGMEKEADQALSRAIKTNPTSPRLRWEAGVFYLLRKRIDRAFENLKVYLLLEPGKQGLVYDLCERVKVEKRYILKDLLPPSYDYYKTYLSYLISHRNLNDAREVWKVISGIKGWIEKGLYLRYIDFLISLSEYNEARQVWTIFLKDFGLNNPGSEGDGILWNGGFENELVGGGFDWGLGKAEGVRVYVDRDIYLDGARSLAVAFYGRYNPDIVAASQIVLLRPDTGYTLKGYIKTDNITTTNGIFIEIVGHDQPTGSCGKGLYKTTDTITGTNPWREVKIDFRTPPDCHAATVRVRRQRSSKFDNKIGGNAWVDKISLQSGRPEG